MSRCTSDRAWACCSARPVWSSTSRVRGTDSRPVRASTAESDSPGDQLHHQVGGAAEVRPGSAGDLAVVVDRGDAGVVQRGGDPGLGAEPLDEFRVAGQLGPQDLQRDDPGQPDVVGGPHLAHAADGDPVAEPVAAGQQQAGRGHHGPPASAAAITDAPDRSGHLGAGGVQAEVAAVLHHHRDGDLRVVGRREGDVPGVRRGVLRVGAVLGGAGLGRDHQVGDAAGAGRLLLRLDHHVAQLVGDGDRDRLAQRLRLGLARSPSGRAWWSWRSGAAPSGRRRWRWSR